MSAINLKRFVDINIKYHEKSVISSNRPTTVLLSSEGSTGTKTYVAYKVDGNGDYTFGYYATPTATTLTYESLDTLTNTEAYAIVYFTNGGNKLKVIFGVAPANIATILGGLPNEEIVVAGCGSFTYSVMEAAAQAREINPEIYGINQKILLGRTNGSDTNLVSNFAVKYSTVVGAEMTIAAYLSNINFDGTDTVEDYMYTKENITPETSNDTVLGQVLDSNMNVVMNIANADLNFGGNLKDGLDLVNQFSLIVLHQTLTDALINLLTTKLKGNNGLAEIQSVVANEMQKYLRNGYLTTDKIWKDANLTVVYNNKTYTIIEKNTPLLQGYRFVTLPLDSLTEADIQNRKTPPMYLIVADGYSIRTITINGEVI